MDTIMAMTPAAASTDTEKIFVMAMVLMFSP